MPKNSGKINISVTILGSGTCVPSLERSSCSVLIQTAESNLVFDTGPGTMRRLTEAGVSVYDVSHVFYSHFHPDHTGELVSFLFANKYPDTGRRKSDLIMGGGPGFSSFYNQLKSVYKEWIDVSGRLKIIEFDHGQNDEYVFDGFALAAAPVMHSPESTAFRVTATDGTTVVYSGDTDYSENLIALAQQADLLICESALPDHMKVNGHLTPSFAGKIARRAKVKKLVLTHFYPECEPADMIAQCRKTYDGPLVLAHDLLTIQLDSE